MTSGLTIRWVTQREANAFVARHHSHNDPVRGDLFRAGAYLDGDLIGVGIVGRPVARRLQDGVTAEVLRICTDGVRRCVTDRAGREHTLPVCATLYAVLARVWAQFGTRLITYTLAHEEASALKGLGWRQVATVRPEPRLGWSRAGRTRELRPISAEPKIRWELTIPAARPLALRNAA